MAEKGKKSTSKYKRKKPIAGLDSAGESFMGVVAPKEFPVILARADADKITPGLLLLKAKWKLWEILDRPDPSAAYIEQIQRLCMKEYPKWQKESGQLVTVDTFKAVQRQLLNLREEEEVEETEFDILTREGLTNVEKQEENTVGATGTSPETTENGLGIVPVSDSPSISGGCGDVGAN